MRLSAVMVSSWRAGKLSSDRAGASASRPKSLSLDVHLDVTLRAKIHDLFGRPLGSGQLGRGTLAGRGTACVRALLVHGSFAVQRLQVRMATVEPMSVCV